MAGGLWRIGNQTYQAGDQKSTGCATYAPLFDTGSYAPDNGRHHPPRLPNWEDGPPPKEPTIPQQLALYIRLLYS